MTHAIYVAWFQKRWLQRDAHQTQDQKTFLWTAQCCGVCENRWSLLEQRIIRSQRLENSIALLPTIALLLSPIDFGSGDKSRVAVHAKIEETFFLIHVESVIYYKYCHNSVNNGDIRDLSAYLGTTDNTVYQAICRI